MLQQLVDDDPEPRPHMIKNLAIALGRAGLDTPEQKARAAEAWRRYLAVAPSDDPQLPAIRKELERLTR
jgi:cytochrome c-type biogenesis protein CcmH/NrfG